MKSDYVPTLPEERSLANENPSSEILAQWLKRSLDKTFGSLVDESIVRLGSTDITSTNNTAGNIFRKISASSDMLAFRSDLEQSIEIALSNIMEKENNRSGSQTPRFNSSGINKPSNSPMAYLQSILKTPLSEVVSSPTWKDLQKVLCDELSNEDVNTFTLVLQIHARLLTSASPVAVKEGFLNLVEGLSLHYLSHQIFLELPNGSQGIKFSNHAHYRIVQISQIILTALCDAPKRWIRFGEKRFEEMIDNFVDMLTMHTYNHIPRKESKHIFFPYHIISTIDPEALWCKNLAHAAYVREITLGSFSKAPSLMRSIVEDVVNWLDQHIHETKDLPAIYNLDSKAIINGNAIKFATFTHSLSVIALIVSYENGWKNFPIQTHLRDEPVSLQEIVVLCLQFLNKASDVEIPLKLSETLINTVVQIMISKGSGILHSANHEVSQTLLQPISSSRQFQIEPCTSTVKILCEIAEFPPGFNWLLKRPESSRRGKISTHSSISSVNESHGSSTQRSSRRNLVRSVSPYTHSTSIAHIVSDFAAFVLKNEETFMSDMYEKLTISVLILCCKLFGQHDGLNVLDTSKSKLLQHTIIAYQHMDHKAKNIIPHNETDQYTASHQNMHRHLHQFLLRVASTPIGYRQLVVSSGIIENVMQDAINTSNPLDPADLWTNTHLCRILQFEDSTQGDTISLRRKLLSKALGHIYTTFENEQALMTGSDQQQNKAVNEFKMKLLLICSSVKVLHSLLEEHEDSSTETTLIDGDPPRTLPHLINLALSECDSLNCLPHWIGLLTLHTLTININFMLLLEARFSFQDTLTNLQSKILDENDRSPSSPNPDLTNIVWDDCSSLRHQILKETFKANDGSSKTISRISSAASSPVSPQPLSWAGRRMQTELQRFLHDTRPGLHDTTWLGHARRAYRLSAHADLKISVLLDLVDQVLRCQPLPDRPSRAFVWPKNDTTVVTKYDLQDKLGAELSLKYGFEQRLIPNTGQQTREQLLILLNQAKSFLQISDPLAPFDWFVASVFLISGGNIERSRSFLQRLAPMASTAFLWSNLSHALFQDDWAATLGHQLETIVAVHFPHAHHALQLAGVSWWWLSERLVQQGLWTVLNIQQIAHAIVLCILHSCDFQLLLRVALLAHLQPRLLQAVAQSTNVITALQKSSQMDFRICDYLPLMDRLAKYCRFTTPREQTL